MKDLRITRHDIVSEVVLYSLREVYDRNSAATCTMCARVNEVSCVSTRTSVIYWRDRII